MRKKIPRTKKVFEELYASIPIPAVLVNIQDEVINFNHAFSRMFGTPTTDCIGKSLSEVLMLPEGLTSDWIQKLNSVAEKRVLPSFDISISNAENEIIKVRVSGHPFNFEKEDAFIFILHDITKIDINKHKLSTSEESQRDILDQLDQDSDLIQSLDTNGNFIFANKKWLDTLGYTYAELPALSIETIIYPDELPYFRHILNEVFRGKPFGSIETIFKTKDGRDIYVKGNMNAFFDKNKLVAIRGVFEDETEQVQTKILYTTLVESSPSGIYLVEDKTFKFVNPQFQSITGYSAEELLGKEPLSIVHPEDIQMVRDNAVQMLKTRQVKASEFRIIRKDGEITWAVETVQPVNFQGKKITLGNLIDITKRKLAEQELHQKMLELETANIRLQELDKLKDSFLSTVSHELRTPLTSIKSFTEILLNYDEDKATQKEFLGIINDESDRLSRLINDFLDLSKIQAGKMQWRPSQVPISAVIESAVRSAQPLINQNTQELSVDVAPDLPLILIDKDRFIQVITNLLNNAIKFTPSGGKIGIKTALQESDKKQSNIIISVSDSGIGIDPKHHQSIFDKFGQVGDTLKDRPKGTGLGLPICKEIVEHFNGRIWVESQLGHGSVFYVTLPVIKGVQAQKVEVKEKPTVANAPKNKTILVVDDEANIRLLIKHELISQGYQVLEASNGKDAIDMARKYKPDLITLDIAMPDIDGFDVTLVLKQNQETMKIPILIVSVVEGQEQAYQLGANDYVTKPFTIETLLGKVKNLLQGSQKTVLVVDDDQSLVKSLEHELRKRGFSTKSAYDGKKALDILNNTHPDIVLLDIKMPEIDGYEVMKTMKNNPKTNDIPIVIMTGVEIDGGRVKALSVGASDYFQKGGGFSYIFEAIERILVSKPLV